MSRLKLNEAHKKTEIICNRCTKNEKEILERKAKSQGKTISEYMIDSSMAGAERRSAREKKRIAQMVRCQEQCNVLQNCILTDAPKQQIQREIQKLNEEMLMLWDY